jgi:hypothetical protein
MMKLYLYILAMVTLLGLNFGLGVLIAKSSYRKVFKHDV